MHTLFKTFTALFLSLLLVACSGGSPESVAKQFVENVYEGDAHAVLELVNLPEDSEEGMKDIVTGKVKSMVASKKAKADQQGGVDSVTTQPFEANQNDEKKGSVKVETRFNKGQVQTDTIKLIKTDDGWKVRL